MKALWFWVDYGLTIVISSGCSALADVICQNIEICYLGHLASETVEEGGGHGGGARCIPEKIEGGKDATEAQEEGEKAAAGVVAHDPKALSGRRTWQFMLSAIPIVVLQYPWFTLILPAIVPGHEPKDIVLDVLLDQLWDFLVIPLLLGANTLVRGKGFAYFLDRVKADTIKIFLWSKLFSLPLEAFMFIYVPLDYQPLFDTLINTLVVIVQSFYVNRVRAVEVEKTKSEAELDKGDPAATTTTSPNKDPIPTTEAAAAAGNDEAAAETAAAKPAS